MKVKIREKGGRGFTLYVPMALASGVLRIVNLWASRQKKSMNSEWANYVDLKIVSKELKKLSKKYKGLTLVDVQSKDGDMVKVII